MNINYEIPVSNLTTKNKFKKLNFTQFTPDIIKIRRKGNVKPIDAKAPNSRPAMTKTQNNSPDPTL